MEFNAIPNGRDSKVDYFRAVKLMLDSLAPSADKHPKLHDYIINLIARSIQTIVLSSPLTEGERKEIAKVTNRAGQVNIRSRWSDKTFGRTLLFGLGQLIYARGSSTLDWSLENVLQSRKNMTPGEHEFITNTLKILGLDIPVHISSAIRFSVYFLYYIADTYSLI